MRTICANFRRTCCQVTEVFVSSDTDDLNRDSPDGFPRLPTMAAQREYRTVSCAMSAKGQKRTSDAAANYVRFRG